MEQTKDYRLLRPFDLEAAKRREAITDSCGGNVVYIDGPDCGQNKAQPSAFVESEGGEL